MYTLHCTVVSTFYSISLFLIIIIIIIILYYQVCKVGRSEEFVDSRSTQLGGRIVVLTLWGLACLPSILLAIKHLDYWYEPWNILIQ